MLTGEEWNEVDEEILSEAKSLLRIFGIITFVIGIVAGFMINELYRWFS